MPKSFTSQIEYGGIAIKIDYNIEESKDHLSKDYNVLQNEGSEHIIRSHFIPWFKSDDLQDKDDDRIYEIKNRYGLIMAKYSPSNTDENIGEFLFFFELGNEYISEMMKSV